MDPATILSAFKNSLSAVREDEFLLHAAQEKNEWFVPGLTRYAIDQMLPWFAPEKASLFQQPAEKSLRVGIIMAGNLPLVGLHDLLTALLAGHHAAVKPSAKDTVLLQAVVEKLPANLQARISLTNEIAAGGIDCLLATGSDNTARYIRHSFAAVPKLIRHNRFSAAVLQGDESESELDALAMDILLFHGMGCRNVSNLLVPADWEPGKLLAAVDRFPQALLAEAWTQVVKWENAIWKMGRRGGLVHRRVVLVENEELKAMPIAHLNIVRNTGEWLQLLAAAEGKLQCRVGREQEVPFGQTQCPGLRDFADGVDTWELLAGESGQRLVGDQ